MTTTIRSRVYSEIPGDRRRVLTAPITDTEGRTWPVGTVYTPLCGGAYQAPAYSGGAYQRISIGRLDVEVRS